MFQHDTWNLYYFKGSGYGPYLIFNRVRSLSKFKNRSHIVYGPGTMTKYRISGLDYS